MTDWYHHDNDADFRTRFAPLTLAERTQLDAETDALADELNAEIRAQLERATGTGWMPGDTEVQR